jgi:hypothetical protein
MVGIRNGCSILIGRPEWKGPLGKYRRRWEDNVEIYITGINNVWVEVDCVNLARDWDWWRTLLNTIMNLRIS